MSAPARIAVQPGRRVVLGEVCSETSAAWARQAVWQGRGRQLREVDVSRLGIGGDQGRLGVSAGVTNGPLEQSRGIGSQRGRIETTMHAGGHAEKRVLLLR